MNDRIGSLTEKRGVILLIFLALGVVGGSESARAQGTEVSVEESLACFEQASLSGHLSSVSRCPPGVVPVEVLLRQRGRFSQATFDAALDGLEDLALTSGSSRVRTGAIARIALLGNESLPADERVAGIVDRLARIYRRSSLKQVRHGILESMHLQEKTEAIRFLKWVATQEPTEHLNPGHAVLVLAAIGPRGASALRELHAEGSVKDAGARGYIERISKHGYQHPRKPER